MSEPWKLFNLPLRGYLHLRSNNNQNEIMYATLLPPLESRKKLAQVKGPTSPPPSLGQPHPSLNECDAATKAPFFYWLLSGPTKTIYAKKRISRCEKRYEKFERTHIRNEGDPWKYIGFLLVQRNSFLETWTTYNDVCPAYH